MEKSKFQLKNEKIYKVEFKLNKKFKFPEDGIPVQLKIDVKNEKIKNNESLVSMEVTVFDEEYLDDAPFFIKIGIEGIFSWDQDVENLENLLRINAPAILMSNVRSIVSQLTAFAGYPPLILPLIDFTQNLGNNKI